MIRSAPLRASSAGPGRIGELVHAASCMLLALAMLARALVPAGFMPERDTRTGAFTVAMCSGGAEHKTMTIPLPGAPSKKDSERKDCAFAAAVVAIAYAHQEAPAPTLIQRQSNYLPPHIASPPTSTRQPNAPPTGPPALA